MKSFFTSLFVSFLSFSLIVTSSPVFAAPVQIDVHPDCCGRKYQVYGEEQPLGSVTLNNTTKHFEGPCSVTVDVSPVSQPGDASPASLGETFDTGRGLIDSATSVASPFKALFESLEIKKTLVDLVSQVFTGHTEKYHAYLGSEIFEPMIEKISGYTTSEELQTYLESQEGQCSSDNPKPDCVIERALCSYEKYVGVLFYQTGQSALNQDLGADVSDLEISQVLSVIQRRDQSLLEEAMHTQEALDTAIAVYSQFFQTYRLHLSFKKVIESLVKVRNLTSYMQELVGCIPNKFIGVATTKCN